MEKALKIAWIKRIQNEVTSSWKIIRDVMVQQYGNLFFLSRCNYDPKLLSLENLSSFYRSILVYWHDFKKSKQNETDFKNEILWNNRNILIDKKPVFYRRWFSHNIVFIRDLFNRHGNLCSYSEFKTLYNLQVPFTTFYGLVDAIPSLWKKTITPQNHTNAEEISMTNLFTGAIYSTIEPPTSQSKILRHGFTEKTLDKVYQLPFKITKEVKLVMFQYEIIHNILPTQFTLHRDGIAESDVCPLCKNERQTLYHLFVLCTEVHSFWNTFQDWWLEKAHERLSLNQSNILYGLFEKSSYWQALNYSILIAKYHIFCTSKGRGVLSFQSFQSFLLRLSDKIQTLQQIAVANKCLSNFRLSWEVLLP